MITIHVYEKYINVLNSGRAFAASKIKNLEMVNTVSAAAVELKKFAIGKEMPTT